MTSTPDLPNDLRLPTPGVLRRFWTGHPRLGDWLTALSWGLPVALATYLAYVAESWYAGANNHAGGRVALVAVLAVVVASIGFFIRRTRPVLALCVLSIALVPAVFVQASPGHVLAVFGVYSLAVYRSNAAAWIGAGALEAFSCAYAFAVAPHADPDGLAHNPVEWVFVYGFELVLALALGTTVGTRRRYLDALVDRAHQLARERDQQSQLAAASERARIARDMHDGVSHSLTVIVALAEGAAAAAGTDARRAASVMRQVADTGRGALTGMRQMLGVLGGDEPAALAPRPTVHDVPALVDQFRGLGLPVELANRATVPDDSATQLTVYRVVQEALTNALRYAHGPTRVTVRIEAANDRVAVVVEDDGLAGMPTASLGAGRGLIGLAERVHALGGTLSAGPRDDGPGWRVATALPLAGRERSS